MLSIYSGKSIKDPRVSINLLILNDHKVQSIWHKHLHNRSTLLLEKYNTNFGSGKWLWTIITTNFRIKGVSKCKSNIESCRRFDMPYYWFTAREGMIIEWPLKGLFQYSRDVIIMSRTVLFRFLSNNGCYLKCRNFIILIKEIPVSSLFKTWFE